MDQTHFNTIEDVHKSSRHLSLEEHGMIQALHQQGFSLCSIATEVGFAHTTVFYELRRGKSNRGRAPQYTDKRDHKAYVEHRRNLRMPCNIDHKNCDLFIQWMAEQLRKNRWSLDACVGYAKIYRLFQPEQIRCTKTLYHMLWADKLPLSLFDVPRDLGHKRRRKWARKNKCMKGIRTEERPAIVNEGSEFGTGKSTPGLASVKALRPSLLPQWKR